MPFHDATRDAVLRFMTQPAQIPSRTGGGLESGISDVLIRGAVNIVDQLINRNQGATGPIPGPGSVPGEMRELSAGGQQVMVRPIGGGGLACPPTSGMGCPGFHKNKSGHWTASGFVAKGTKWVKNRRMNPLNPRAARRSIRRLQGTAAFARAMGFKGDIVIKPPTTRRRKIV